jgi:hypothetical protein
MDSKAEMGESHCLCGEVCHLVLVRPPWRAGADGAGGARHWPGAGPLGAHIHREVAVYRRGRSSIGAIWRRNAVCLSAGLSEAMVVCCSGAM